jgi:predicted DNA-binding protein
MTKLAERRINARLPAEVARKIAYLEERTKKSTTEVVIESIELYYEALKDGPGTAVDLLEQAGFIGCAEGPADLSSTYKAMLARSLSNKT